jgi:hypothetical protein
MSREEELTAQGWRKQATTDEPRLSEMAAMYAEIGFEVLLEPFHPGQEKGCSGCLAASPERFKTLYTRRKKEAP